MNLVDPKKIPHNITIEACIQSLEEALESERNDVHQLEICSRLDLDGLTPDKQLVLDIISQCNALSKVMIRPRGGNFVHNHVEIKKMIEDIMWCQDHGIKQIVLGVLTDRNEVDVPQLQLFSDAAQGMEITFHKAIDLVPDPLKAIDQLRQFHNVRYILSSGQAKTAWEGRAMLVEMIAAGGEDIDIIVAGKVRYQNLATLHEAIGARYYHGRGF